MQPEIGKPYKCELQRRLKFLCWAYNTSQRDIAKAIGITEEFISIMYAGKHPLSTRTANRLSDLFGIKPEWFYGKCNFFDGLNKKQIF